MGAGVSSLESTSRQHKAQIFFPAQCLCGGRGAPSQPAQASYFLPVRWMCWKRVMEKAMPRICKTRGRGPGTEAHGLGSAARPPGRVGTTTHGLESCWRKESHTQELSPSEPLVQDTTHLVGSEICLLPRTVVRTEGTKDLVLSGRYRGTVERARKVARTLNPCQIAPFSPEYTT